MHRFLIAVFVLCLFLSVAFGQGVPPPDVELNEVQKLIVASQSLFTEKKFDESLTTLKKAHTLQPENHGILAMMGGIYLMQNKSDLASEQFAKAIALAPGFERYHFFKASSDRLRGAREEGLIAVRRSIELSPSNAEGYYLLGDLLGMGGGNVAERTEAFRKAIELEPKMLMDLKYIGTRLENVNKDPKAAEEAYRIAIDVDPKKMAGRFDLGRMLVEQGRLKEARELWTGRTSDIDNTFPNFIDVLKRAENLVSAKAAYEKSPNDPDALVQMGIATMDGDHWVVDGRQEKAIVFFKKALEIRPDFTKAQHAICKAYVQIADTYKAKNKELDEEMAKLREMDVKLANEIVEYRKTYKGGLSGVPAGPPPPKKP
jgi:tetratricopeptide (TPR) repeat protein